MIWCDTHHRWEIWMEGEMYGWISEEESEIEQKAFFRVFCEIVLNPRMCLTPEPHE